MLHYQMGNAPKSWCLDHAHLQMGNVPKSQCAPVLHDALHSQEVEHAKLQNGKRSQGLL